MSEFHTITASKGPGGRGGPLTITPDEKRNKVVYIVGGGQKPEVVDRIAEPVGAEAVSGFNTRVSDDEHFCVVVDCGGSLRCDPYLKEGILTINVVPTDKTSPLVRRIHEGIYVSVVGVDQVCPVDTDEVAGAQAATTAESAQKSVPTKEGGHPMELTEQMATKQKKSLLGEIRLGAGKVIAVFYQAGRNAVQMMISTILPFASFVAMLVDIIRASGLGDWFFHLLTPLAGSGWGLVALELIYSLLFLSPLLGPGAVIARVIGTPIGTEIGRSNVPPQLSPPALLAIDTQSACDFIPTGMGLGEAEPETTEIDVPAMLYSWFLNGVPRVTIAWLANIGLYPQS